MEKQKLIEVARSFSRKLNMGNYTTADFFCSAKEEVSAEEIGETSKRLFDFCKAEVEKSVREYEQERPKPEKPLSYKQIDAYDEKGEAVRQETEPAPSTESLSEI